MSEVSFAGLPAAVRIARPTDQLEEVARFYPKGSGYPSWTASPVTPATGACCSGCPACSTTWSSPSMITAALPRCPAATTCSCSISTIRPRWNRLPPGWPAGHLPVAAENPYWTEHGAVTVEDPDHWRVVLMPQPLA